MARTYLLVALLAQACASAVPDEILVDGKADTGGRADTAFPSAGFIRTPADLRLKLPSRTFCTATLIAPNVILTAAHCVDDLENTALLGDVRFGIGPLGKPTVERPIDLSSIRIAPGYDSSFAQDHLAVPHHDLAIAFLDEPITEVQPARIVANPDAEQLGEAPCAYVSVGYGVTNVRTEEQERRSAVKCFVGMTEDASDLLVQGTAGGTCHGDSGGPLALKPQKPDDPFLVVGVASRAGDEDPNAPLCGDRSKTYFTYAYAHRQFIAESMLDR